MHNYTREQVEEIKVGDSCVGLRVVVRWVHTNEEAVCSRVRALAFLFVSIAMNTLGCVDTARDQ